ncbi:MAG: hypothetical protein IT377_28060 [Polyangiaceae bacterium]|nr:hypothetical protein [Polyangiaceae bacterium]
MTKKVYAWAVFVTVALGVSASIGFAQFRERKRAPPAGRPPLAASEPKVIVVRDVARDVVPDDGRHHSPTPSGLAPTPPSDVAGGEEHSEAVVTARLEEAFGNDRPATSYTRAVEADLRAGFEDPVLQGVRVERVECRATTCRAVVTFADTETTKTATSRVLVDPTTAVSTKMGFVVPAYEPHPDGSVTATIFLYVAEANPNAPAEP